MSNKFTEVAEAITNLQQVCRRKGMSITQVEISASDHENFAEMLADYIPTGALLAPMDETGEPQIRCEVAGVRVRFPSNSAARLGSWD